MLIKEFILFKKCRFTTERSFKKVDRFFKTPKATNIAFKLNFTLLLCRFGTAKVQRNFHFSLKKV